MLVYSFEQLMENRVKSAYGTFNDSVCAYTKRLKNYGYTRCSAKGYHMAESIPGDLHVANDVLADLVGNAALQCYGVVGMSAPTAADGIAKLLPASRLRRGVVVDVQEAGVHVDLYVIIEYGTNITTVSQNLIEAVTFALTNYAQVPLLGVDVHVQGVKVRK